MAGCPFDAFRKVALWRVLLFVFDTSACHSEELWLMPSMVNAGIRYIEENDYPVRGTYGFSSGTAGAGQGY